MILAATPSPGIDPGGLISKEAEEAITLGGEPDPEEVLGFVDSVREGGGAMAAPPEVAVEKQSRLVWFELEGPEFKDEIRS